MPKDQFTIVPAHGQFGIHIWFDDGVRTIERLPILAWRIPHDAEQDAIPVLPFFPAKDFYFELPSGKYWDVAGQGIFDSWDAVLAHWDRQGDA